MGCACGDKNQKVTYTYTAPSGSQTRNLSEAQARAMQIRNGGTFRKN